jgi:hypothetical protein
MRVFIITEQILSNVLDKFDLISLYGIEFHHGKTSGTSCLYY